jgi:hypothetical protein
MATPVSSRPVKTLNRSGAPPPAPAAASAVAPIPVTVPPSKLPAEFSAATALRQVDVTRIVIDPRPGERVVAAHHASVMTHVWAGWPAYSGTSTSRIGRRLTGRLGTDAVDKDDPER